MSFNQFSVSDDKKANKSEELLNNDLVKLINNRIEVLRLKLLDLTRRNPLISTRFSDRSNSILRIVDEIPILFLKKLIEGNLRFKPLPPLEEDPKDELSNTFQSALADARLTDETYLNDLDKIEQDGDKESAELLSKAERELKDRIREKLIMPPRQTAKNISLNQHAINHYINPNYELPIIADKHEDGRHDDNSIQTLLLPDMLERRLNNIIQKNRMFKEEKGVNVLHIAFGFLEWCDKGTNHTIFSPLLLLPVEIVKTRTPVGSEFFIKASETFLEWNTVLSEKLKLDYDIALPPYDSENIDSYLQKLSNIKPKNITWKIHNWAVTGIFPSTRMSMYHDLNTATWNFSKNNIISTLFAGETSSNNSIEYGDEYNTDENELEIKVPCLIADTDSSQFSALIDVSDGKNTALEGPPGTGKSQTIINAIACALVKGKKVLFVAEKEAALEVVKSRLEAYGVGEFILTLQATRSSKEEVIKSIKHRLELKRPPEPKELSGDIEKYKELRSNIARYIKVISSGFGESGLTVYKIFAHGIYLKNDIANLPQALKEIAIVNIQGITIKNRQEYIENCLAIETAWKEIQGREKWWEGIRLSNLDPFTSDEVLHLAARAANAFQESNINRSGLKFYDIPTIISPDAISDILEAVNLLKVNSDIKNIEMAQRIYLTNSANEIQNHIISADSLMEIKNRLVHIVNSIFAEKLSTNIYTIANTMKVYEINNLEKSSLIASLEVCKKRIVEFTNIKSLLDKIIEIYPTLKDSSAKIIVTFCDFVKSYSFEELSLRKKCFEDSEILFFMKDSNRLCQELKIKEKELERFLYLDKIKNALILIKLADALENGNIFRLLISKKYRSAIKYFKYISKIKRINKETLQILRETALWLDKKTLFEADVKVKDVLGTQFSGINSDFSIIMKTIDFYSKINELFDGYDFNAIRQILLYMPTELLISTPKIEKDHPIRLSGELTQPIIIAEISNLEIKLESIQKLVETIDDIFLISFDKKQCVYVFLENLASDILKFQTGWNLLSSSPLLHNIQVEDFVSIEHLKNKFSYPLQLSKKLSFIEEGVSLSMLVTIIQDNCGQLINLLSDIILSDQQKIAFIEKLSAKTYIPTERWVSNRGDEDIYNYLMLASKDKVGLMAHSRYFAALDELEKKGYKQFTDSITDELCKERKVSTLFDAMLTYASVKEIYKTYGATLSTYNGLKLNLLRRELASIDRKIIELSRANLRYILHINSNAPNGNGIGKISSLTNMALISHEVAKKTRHIPIRELTSRAGEALLELKPCWMMSPLAVSQFIEKNNISFDLVIIDEASQMTPENAIGAIIRGNQVMVVGDTNQLPPSNFFRKIIEDDEGDQDEIVAEESILEMANSVFKPIRRLRWHYRSKCSNLISFSNKYIYGNNLIVFPSVNDRQQDLGIYFNKVNGFYSAGTNPIEAKFIVEAILKFMSEHPNMSLGVAVLNQKQRDLISDEMNFAIQQNQFAFDYISNWENKNDGLESFFIKNLENVQGDERDAIFIGTVYGPEQPGARVMQRFGPINGVSGKRRLNVLFTRAKKMIVTFSSMVSSDIVAEEHTNPGTNMLKRWLEYSETGQLEGGEITSKEPDSDFEVYVMDQLKSFGCEAIPQVGVKGYFIDIGVKHSDWPHGFIMGVECDGATYHSAKSARDRDRLRQEVLENLGWTLYRIWSTDWFEDPIQEANKLRQAIQDRLKELIGN